MENSYFGIKAVSNTALGYINPDEKGCPEKFFDFLEGRFQQKESKSMLTGTLVHARILEPDSVKLISVPKISDNVKLIVDRVFAEHYDEFTHCLDLSPYEEQIVEIAKEEGYGQSWKKETMVGKVRNEGGDAYFKLLVENIGKTVVPEDIYSNLLKIESAIKNNPAAYELFFQEDVHGIESLNEVEVMFDVELRPGKTLACKSKIDRLIINHDEGTFKIIDLKTTSESVEFFPYLFNTRHIYRQIAMYETAALAYLNKYYTKQSFVPGVHTILACETTGYSRVRRFDISQELVKKGHTEKESLFNRILWHLDNNEKKNSMEDVYSEFSFLLSEENS